MKTLNIKNKSYQIPQNWNDITLKKFLQLRDHEKMIDHMPLFDYNLDYLSIVTEIPNEELLDLTPNDIGNLIKELIEVTRKDVSIIEEPIISIDGTIYVMDKNLDKLQLGQFVDLDYITKEGDVWDNAHKICASFMRPAKISRFDKLFKKNIKCESYKVDEYDYKALVRDSEIFYEKMPMTYIYTCVTFFFTFRQNLTRRFEGLFPSANDGEQVELTNDNEPKTPEQIFGERWNWYSVIIDLCQEDLTRFNEITSLPLIQVLNHLSYKKEKADLEKHIQNKNNNTKVF